MDLVMNRLPAIIPAAGLGTRFLPFTKVVPKELVPLNGRPAIEYIMQECVSNNIDNVYIIANKDKQALYNFFNADTAADHALIKAGKHHLLDAHYAIINKLTVQFVEQPEPKGLGHAIACAQQLITSDYCAVLLPDDLIIPNNLITQMYALAQQHNASVIAVQSVALEHVSSYGIIQPGKQLLKNACFIDGIIEKPTPAHAPSQLAVIGRYVLSTAIFDALQHIKPGAGGELQLTDALAQLIATGHPIIAYHYDGHRFDLGNPAGFLQANIFISQH